DLPHGPIPQRGRGVCRCPARHVRRHGASGAVEHMAAAAARASQLANVIDGNIRRGHRRTSLVQLLILPARRTPRRLAGNLTCAAAPAAPAPPARPRSAPAPASRPPTRAAPPAPPHCRSTPAPAGRDRRLARRAGPGDTAPEVASPDDLVAVTRTPPARLLRKS